MDNGVLEERLLASEAEEQPNLKRRILVESKLIWRIAFPSILARVTSFGMVVVTQLFIGHVSALDLASYALVQSVFVQFVNGILVAGAMGAYTIASWLPIFGEFVYIFGGWCPNTWKGFTTAAFVDLWPIVKLSVSSGVMLCLELWYTAILVLLAGYMTNATISISAFSICLNISTWELMIFLGFLGAACVRVSNELGKGNAKAAIFSIKVILGTSISIGVVFWILCLAFGNKISYWFTSDEEVAEAVSSLSTLLAFSLLLNSVQPVLTGVAVGGGFQGIVAIVNICCYYVFGVPIGLVLAYVADLQVKGLWIGMLCGVLLQTFVLSIIIWRTDWDKEVKKASERLNRWLLKSPKESNQS
ncbi:protein DETOXIFICATION 24-like [Fagus crenata]